MTYDQEGRINSARSSAASKVSQKSDTFRSGAGSRTLEVTARKMRNLAIVFLVLAIAFIAIGISGQRPFMYIGIAFLVVALLRWHRARN